MSTNETVEQKIDAVDEKIKASFENGVEKFIDSQETIAQVFDATAKRSLKVTEKFTENVVGTHQEFIELYRNMAKEPQAYGKNAEAWMDSMTNLQQRTLEFAKLMYKEQSEGAAELKDTIAPFMDSGKRWQETTKEWMGAWTKPFQLKTN